MKQKLLKKIKSINLKPVKDFFVHFYQKHKKLSLAVLIIFGINYLSLFVLKILPYKELKELQNKPYSTRIYDANGYLIQVETENTGLTHTDSSMPVVMQISLVLQNQIRAEIHTSTRQKLM